LGVNSFPCCTVTVYVPGGKIGREGDGREEGGMTLDAALVLAGLLGVFDRRALGLAK